MTLSPELLFTIANFAIMLATIMGGYLAFRLGNRRQVSEIQAHVIEAMEAEMGTITREVEALKAENLKQQHVIETIKSVMGKLGYVITIDGNAVYVQDTRNTMSASPIGPIVVPKTPLDKSP